MEKNTACVKIYTCKVTRPVLEFPVFLVSYNIWEFNFYMWISYSVQGL